MVRRNLTSFGQGGVRLFKFSFVAERSLAPTEFCGNARAGKTHRVRQGRRPPRPPF